MKIAITGMGVLSSAGENKKETLKTFSESKRKSGKVTLFPTDLSYPAFEVINLPDQFQNKGSRTIQLACAALQEALEDSGWGDEIFGKRIGVALGTTVACQLNDLPWYEEFKEKGDAPLEPIEKYLKGNLAQFVTEELKASGPSLTVVNACSSGSDAIGIACSWLQNDLCDIAIAGGADELNKVPYVGFASLGIMSEDLCAPFDKNRKGLNLGEGAGIVILEKNDDAKKRGVNPNLFVSGYGSAGDAFHLTAPRPDGSGLQSAIQKALKQSGITPDKISFINAHGTSTPDNDKVEGLVFEKVFGKNIKFISTKGYTGHTLGAAGGIEAVFSLLALKEGWVPSSIGFDTPDPDTTLSPLKEKTVISGNYALSTSLAFGGNNTALVFEKGVE